MGKTTPCDQVGYGGTGIRVKEAVAIDIMYPMSLFGTVACNSKNSCLVYLGKIGGFTVYLHGDGECEYHLVLTIIGQCTTGADFEFKVGFPFLQENGGRVRRLE